MSDVDELTRELDLDAALARTYELGEGMRRRSTTRKRWAGGGALAAAAVAAALIVPTIGGDASDQGIGFADGGATTEVPATTVPESPATTVEGNAVPDGYDLIIDGDIWILQRSDVVPETTTSSDGAAVGIGDAAASQRGTVESFAPVADPNAVSVTFACVVAEQQLDVVRYRVEPTRIVVDAEINYDPAAAGCLPSSEGSTISLPLPVPYVPGTPIVAEPLHTP